MPLLCIAEGGGKVSEQGRRRVTPEHWFKPARAMRELFADLPDACDNTVAVARMCAVMAESRKPLLPVSPKVLAGETEDSTIRAMAVAGLARRMDAMGADGETRTRYGTQLEYELGVIAGMGFPGYFLIVADFIQWAKSQGIPVGPGAWVRGRVGGGVGVDHHGFGPVAVGVAVRAVPEPGAGCRCRTSTSTFARIGGTRSLRMCGASTVGTGSRRSSRSGNCRRGRRCGMWGGCWGCRSGR